MSGGWKRVLVVVGVLAVAFAGLGVGLLLGGDDGGTPESTKTTDATKTSGTDDSPGDTSTSTTVQHAAPPVTVATTGLTGDALELATAINRASGLTYHATYQGTGKDKNGSSTQVKVEIWRQLPLARRDTTIVTNDGTLHTEELRLEDRLLGCVDRNKGDTEPDFVCFPSAGKGVDPAEPVIGLGRPASGTVVARNETVGGVGARCFRVTLAVGTKVQDVCFDGDGIPVAIDGGDSRLVRSDLGRGVDPATIAIPPDAEMQNSADPAGPTAPA
jgi:hypothetical protein